MAELAVTKVSHHNRLAFEVGMFALVGLFVAGAIALAVWLDRMERRAARAAEEELRRRAEHLKRIGLAGQHRRRMPRLLCEEMTENLSSYRAMVSQELRALSEGRRGH